MQNRSDKVLDELRSIVNGFKGYSDKDSRISSDRLVREVILKNISDSERMLRDILTSIRYSVTGDLTLLIDISITRLMRIKENIGMVDEELERFYSAEEVSSSLVTSLMRHDLKIINLARRLKEYIFKLYSRGVSGAESRMMILMIIDALKVLEAEWDRRMKIIKELEGDS